MRSSSVHEPVGRHAWGDLLGCLPDVLLQAQLLATLLVSACDAAGATVVRVVVHEFAPQGATIVVVLAESHATIHTYPEHGAAFVDAFTCGKLDPTTIVRSIALALGVNNPTIGCVPRG